MNTFEEVYKKIISEDYNTAQSEEDNTDLNSIDQTNEDSPINFSININLENAAFNDDPESRDTEIIRILEKIIADIENGKQFDQASWSIMDINGNRVGEVTYK